MRRGDCFFWAEKVVRGGFSRLRLGELLRLLGLLGRWWTLTLFLGWFSLLMCGEGVEEDEELEEEGVKDRETSC